MEYSKERWPGGGEKVSSERILTHDVLPSQFILSIEDMEKKIEFKDKHDNFLADKIRNSHEKVLKQMEKTNLNEISKKTIGVKRRLSKTHEKHKQIIC